MGAVLQRLPMTRHGWLLAIVFAVELCACGGSSSETPPPLEPDPRGFYYAGVSAVQPEASDAGSDSVARSNASDDEDDDKPRTPARSTWGSQSPRK